MAHDQQEVIQFLGNPKSHASCPAVVKQYETHGAIIFIAGDDVYKIKKAVKFSYMDFSTLELRKKVCMREIEINRKSAPSIYINAIPITQDTNGVLSINGPGTAVEWAVHMHRFEQDNVLASLAENGLITNELVKKLAKAVAEYHEQAPVKHHVNITGNISHLIDDLENIFSAAPDIFGNDSILFASRARELLVSSQEVLKNRSEHGYIRRCHGDLHLQNIVSIEGNPVLFDAIEFDEDLATIDIFYDLAFLLMDLQHRGLKHAANLTLNRYLFYNWTTPNLEGLQAMPLFLACRAAIRAMVNAQQAGQTAGDNHGGFVSEARSYMHAALDYMETSPPRLIAIGGLSGTGKSTLAASLAPALGNAPGALHLRSDLERKNMFEVEETEKLPPQLYTPEVGFKVYEVLLRKAELALRSGHSVIVDAVFKEEERRNDIQRLAERLNIPFTGLWLTAPPQTLFSRVDNRKNDASDAKSDVVKKQLQAETGQINWNIVNSGGSPTDAVIEASRLL